MTADPQKPLFWCSEFCAYILPERCKTMREVPKRGLRPVVIGKGGKPRPVRFADLQAELEAVAKLRQPCVDCPGVARRSYNELRRGELL